MQGGSHLNNLSEEEGDAPMLSFITLDLAGFMP